MAKHIRLLTTLLFSLLFANAAMAGWETVNIREKQYVTCPELKILLRFQDSHPIWQQSHP